MRATTFLEGDWIGRGVVRGAFGRVLRRFEARFSGSWSDAHEAVHLDEHTRYEDGRSFERAWAVAHLGLGAWAGTDNAGGRLAVRDAGDRLILSFHRTAAIRAITVGSLRLVLRRDGTDAMHGRGVTRFLGVPVAWTEIAFTRPAP